MSQVEQARVPLWRFGDAFRDESSKPSLKCANPERWTMMDELTPEVEVLAFLRSMVILCKPERVLVLSDATGYVTAHIGQALRENGIGAVFAAGLDEKEEQMAIGTCGAAGLERFVQFGHIDALDHEIFFDMAFVGDTWGYRSDEFKRMKPNSLIFFHARQSENAKLDENVAVLNLPTPRGLAILQAK